VKKRYNYWTVIGEPVSAGNNQGFYVKCRCVCGTERLVRRRNLTLGHSHSCGCRGTVTKPKLLKKVRLSRDVRPLLQKRRLLNEIPAETVAFVRAKQPIVKILKVLKRQPHQLIVLLECMHVITVAPTTKSRAKCVECAIRNARLYKERFSAGGLAI
jgi:hypothetical protein